MATSGGQLLVPKALRAIRLALEKTGRVLRDKFPQATSTVHADVQPIYARSTIRNTSTGRISGARQSQSRWYSTRRYSFRQTVELSLRRLSSSTQSVPKHERSALPTSRTGQAVYRLTTRCPFASTLRPNLTGGTLYRSAGGYGTAGRIGGARYFSHSPAAPAQVVNDVSQAVRAFWLSGRRAQFDGMSPRDEKRFKTVSKLQASTVGKMRSVPTTAPGSYIDFNITPTITAVGPLGKNSNATSPYEQESLNNELVLNVLSVDFARGLKDLAIVMNDLQKLSRLGDLSLSLPSNSTLRVRFPGCDADTVHRLCEELDVRRGLVYQEDEFDSRNGTEMALLFPFAPHRPSVEINFLPKAKAGQVSEHDFMDWQNMPSAHQDLSPNSSAHSITSHDFGEVEVEETPSFSPSAYSSLDGSDEGDAALDSRDIVQGQVPCPSAYEGLEGIYRFLEECDRARR